MQKLMGDEGWGGGGGLFFSTDPMCLWFKGHSMLNVFEVSEYLWYTYACISLYETIY